MLLLIVTEIKKTKSISGLWNESGGRTIDNIVKGINGRKKIEYTERTCSRATIINYEWVTKNAYASN